MTSATFTPLADLEPTSVGRRTYVTRYRRARIDAPLVLSIMIILIMMIKADLVVASLTGLGRPGLLVGFVLFWWWLFARLTNHLSMRGPQPMRWAVMATIISAVASYAVAFSRSLTSIESGGADRAMLSLCVFSGIILAAADGIPNMRSFNSVIKVLVTCAAIVGAIALVQFATAFDITAYMTLPGLQSHFEAIGFEDRGAGIRVAATMTHYIELGAVLATCMPFAIHLAMHGETKRGRRWAILASVLIAAGNMCTISRTGQIGLLLTIVALFPVWSWRERYNFLGVAGVLVVVLTAVKPSMTTTMLHLFDGGGSNSAFTVRQARYPIFYAYFEQSPWLGRGTGTWMPPQYQIFDNQWLVTLLSIGVIGAAATLGLYLTGAFLASRAFRVTADRRLRHLAACLIATQLIAITVSATFDALAFTSFAAILALTVGLCGAFWRLTHPDRQVRTATTRWYLSE